MATEHYRRNAIVHCTVVNGSIVTDHAEKSELFWQEFMSRMGAHDFEYLILPFESEEMSKIALYMLTNKAPGPDGYNGLFLKCWAIIKEDIFALFQGFYSHTINLSCINYSYITLVPKKLNL